jgi:flagellar motor switch protein FliG
MIESELTIPVDSATPGEIAKARKRIAATAIGLAATGALELPTMQDAA